MCWWLIFICVGWDDGDKTHTKARIKWGGGGGGVMKMKPTIRTILITQNVTSVIREGPMEPTQSDINLFLNLLQTSRSPARGPWRSSDPL